MADGHNGWTNYETWNVNLWIDSDETSQRHWRCSAQEVWDDAKPTEIWTREESAVFALADRLKDEIEGAKDDFLDDIRQQCSMWADLLGAALSEVNWREIAESMISEVDRRERGD